MAFPTNYSRTKNSNSAKVTSKSARGNIYKIRGDLFAGTPFLYMLPRASSCHRFHVATGVPPPPSQSILRKRSPLMPKRNAIVTIQECVACGCCVKVCPKNAISIYKGTYAKINKDLCVGCGKCAKECPASVIAMEVLKQ